jgi:hypothetical protein
MSGSAHWKTQAATTVGVILGGIAVSLAVDTYRTPTEEKRMLAAVPEHPLLTYEDRLRIAQAMRRSMSVLPSGSELDAQLARALAMPVRTEAERNRAVRTLSARGISALSLAQLDEVYAIKLALARSSPIVCAGMWNGRADPSELYVALARLPQAQMERWMQLSTEGLRLALRPGLSVPNEDQAAIEAVIEAAAARMDETQRTRFQQTIDQGPEAPPLDGCFAWTALLEAARDSEPALRERFYRTMAR